MLTLQAALTLSTKGDYIMQDNDFYATWIDRTNVYRAYTNNLTAKVGQWIQVTGTDPLGLMDQWTEWLEVIDDHVMVLDGKPVKFDDRIIKNIKD